MPYFQCQRFTLRSLSHHFSSFFWKFNFNTEHVEKERAFGNHSLASGLIQQPMLIKVSLFITYIIQDYFFRKITMLKTITTDH